MEDQVIFKIALATSILGLMGMMFFADDIAPREVKIMDLNRGMLDEDVSVEGVVQSVKKSSQSNTYFMDIMDGTGKISLIIFDSSVQDLQKANISISGLSNRRVKVTGKVSEYQGKIEIILKDASSLKLLA
ncbi:MAG: OB-fold nucleic acid binding domain protein [Methanobacterium sp. PtaU1.Bin242]|nr:MAG: OB-fold nucleic acid binding domain protein [Methanobacterium sp. PtaU1.Bin242]